MAARHVEERMKKFGSSVPVVATTDDEPPTPPGYKRIVSTSWDDQLTRVCSCERCEADGQHMPMCGVHERDEDDRPWDYTDSPL
jgi:hypothetical protein